MPVVHLDDRPCYYRLDGPDRRPVLVLSHSLGLDHAMWDPQVADLLPHFQILRYDIRGHGASAGPDGDYTVDTLGGDVVALTERLGLRKFAFCGLSLGGMIGQWLGVNAADRLTHLVLANTSPRPDAAAMEQRRRTALEHGMAAIETVAMGRSFSERILNANPPVVPWARRTLLATDPRGYAGCCAAIRDLDTTASLGHIRTPTLVISGNLDVPMPWHEHGERLARGIPEATVVHLPAAHLSSLETPRTFSAALMSFLLPTPDGSLESGLAIRRDVLGADHVDRAMAGATDFTRDFQELITKYAWGTIWARPGLDHRTRRLLVLAMTASLGRWEEFRLHLEAGLARDLEPCEVKEVLLQLAVYAGVPAGSAAFRAASDVTGRT